MADAPFVDGVAAKEGDAYQGKGPKGCSEVYAVRHSRTWNRGLLRGSMARVEFVEHPCCNDARINLLLSRCLFGFGPICSR